MNSTGTMNSGNFLNAASVERRGSWGDWLGMLASIGCAIHCAAMPFVLGYLPALGLSFLADESFHKWMALGCFLLAVIAFIPGLRRHGRLLPVVVGCFGLTMISTAAFGFTGECCTACAAASDSRSSSRVVAQEEVCCEDGCCDAKDAGARSNVMRSDQPPELPKLNFAGLSFASPMLPSIMPLVTPLGGLLLVCAHLLNRRFDCSCDCCQP